MEQAEDALAAAQTAVAEVGSRAEAVARRSLESLESALSGRIDTLRRDLEVLRLQVHGQDQILQATKADNSTAARERASALDKLATLQAEVSHLKAATDGKVTSARESMKTELSSGLADLRHDLQVRVAKHKGEAEAETSKLSAAFSTFDG